MKKSSKIIGIIIVIAIIVLAAFKFSTPAVAPTVTEEKKTLGKDPLNLTYVIDEESVTLTNGISEEQLAESMGDFTTSAFGKPVYGDLNGDGKDDAIFFVSQETPGTGIFFYVVAAAGSANGFTPTNSIFLGDRIAPQNINIMKGVANVNYADRKEGEPMIAQPSVGVTKYLSIKNGSLVEVK